MASKNKSERLGLNLWAESDRPQRGDFNNDNMILEDALGGHIENENLHLSAEEKTRVAYPLAVTVYAGDGQGQREITLPCKGQAVAVFCGDMPSSLYDSAKGCVKVYSAFYVKGAGAQTGVSVSGDKLTVSHQSAAQSGYMVCLNESGKQYKVVVLR